MLFLATRSALWLTWTLALRLTLTRALNAAGVRFEGFRGKYHRGGRYEAVGTDASRAVNSSQVALFFEVSQVAL